MNARLAFVEDETAELRGKLDDVSAVVHEANARAARAEAEIAESRVVLNALQTKVGKLELS